MVNLVWLLAQAAENATASSPEDQISEWVNAVPEIAFVLGIVLFVGAAIENLGIIISVLA